jgi:hypothetical protein
LLILFVGKDNGVRSLKSTNFTDKRVLSSASVVDASDKHKMGHSLVLIDNWVHINYYIFSI